MGIFDVFKKKAKIPQQIDRPNETVNIVNQVSASGRTNATQVDIDFDTINSIKSTFVAFDVETTGLSASIDAKAFRQIKDYSNEILIIDEFLSRNTYGKEGVFSARRDKVIKLLFTQQESEHKVQKTAPE